MKTAYELLASTLKARGVDVIFHITGAPNIHLTIECEKRGISLVGVRHEQAATAMAFAYARLRGKPGICLAPAGPGAANMVAGAVHAKEEQTPIIVLGGSSPLAARGSGSFQEMDQMALFKPAVKAAFQLTDPADIVTLFDRCWATASEPCQGPAYLDLPGDILYSPVPDFDAIPPSKEEPSNLTPPLASSVDALLDCLADAERPLIVSGSGLLWSKGASALEELVDRTGVPFYTTPQSRGVIAEDHPLAFLGARTQAFREADMVLSVGTRSNFIVGQFRPPRWGNDVRLCMINLDEKEIARSRPAVGIRADARVALEALSRRLVDRPIESSRFAPWIQRLAVKDRDAKQKLQDAAGNNAFPIHPTRLMAEIAAAIDRDAIIIEDGHDTIGFCRHSLRSNRPGYRMNPGTQGNVGLGVAFGVGAKAAAPDRQVVVVSGDSAFGWNGMEFHTACHHNLPIVVVICNNGGITAKPALDGSNDYGFQEPMPGQDLGIQNYQLIAEAFGGYGERVDRAEDIGPALGRALTAGRPAIVNVIVDEYAASATHMGFAGVLSESYTDAKRS